MNNLRRLGRSALYALVVAALIFIVEVSFNQRILDDHVLLRETIVHDVIVGFIIGFLYDTYVKISEQIDKVLKRAEKISQIVEHEEQDTMYNNDLIEYVDKKKPREAILIQYCGDNSASLVKALLRRGARVTLYIQSPETAVSVVQKNRIQHGIDEIPTLLPLEGAGSITVYTYDVPSSIKGVIIDDKVLGIGWYLYERMPEANRVELWGHNVPGMVIRAGNHEFDVFRKMFLRQVRYYEKRRNRVYPHTTTTDASRWNSAEPVQVGSD